MTNITLEMNEALCKAVGFVFEDDGTLDPSGEVIPSWSEDLTDPTNWFKWVAPKLLSENSSSFDLYVFLGGAIVKVREHGKTVAVTDEELPGHALFLAAWELLVEGK